VISGFINSYDVCMIDRLTGFTARAAVFGLIITFLVSVTFAQDDSARNPRIPACGAPQKGYSLIGWGKHGLFFSVPKRGVEILGGKPDVDYVKFVIKRDKLRGGSCSLVWTNGVPPRPTRRDDT
jgi:hypothetical protein